MPPTVFISYSHKDKVWKDRLLTHLGVLEEGDLLQTWSDQQIRAGDEWFTEIREAMEAARVAVLLVSANSLTSKFILKEEVARLLERRAQEGVVVFPVIVKDCAWQKVSWLAKLQVRPPEGKPLALRGIRIDSELKAIAEEILDIVQNGSKPSAPPRDSAVAVSSTLPSRQQLPASLVGKPHGAPWHKDLEVVLTKRDVDLDFIGAMPAYSSTKSQFPNRTTLMGHLSSIEIINHSQTAPTEVISMRFGLFDLATEEEIEPVETLELKFFPETRKQRRIPPVDRQTFSFQSTVSFSGHLDRATLLGRLFLMIKVIGARDELKIELEEALFSHRTKGPNKSRVLAGHSERKL